MQSSRPAKVTKKEINDLVSRHAYAELVDRLVSACEEPIAIAHALNAYQAFEHQRAKRVEQFMVLTMNQQHKAINMRIISSGIASKTVVHPREIFIGAISDGAAAIVICHNHPSGNVCASEEDIQLTKRIKEAGEILGITLLDSLIIVPTRGVYVSLMESGDMN